MGTGEDEGMPFRWEIADNLPKPEDFVSGCFEISFSRELNGGSVR